MQQEDDITVQVYEKQEQQPQQPQESLREEIIPNPITKIYLLAVLLLLVAIILTFLGLARII
jgi:hypothetical protein